MGTRSLPRAGRGDGHDDAKTGQYFVCQLCGCTLNRLPVDACPVCKNPPRHYRHIEPPA
jgi:rubrerythrin